MRSCAWPASSCWRLASDSLASHSMEAKYEKLCLACLLLLEAGLYQLIMVLYLQADHSSHCI